MACVGVVFPAGGPPRGSPDSTSGRGPDCQTGGCGGCGGTFKQRRLGTGVKRWRGGTSARENCFSATSLCFWICSLGVKIQYVRIGTQETYKTEAAMVIEIEGTSARSDSLDLLLLT